MCETGGKAPATRTVSGAIIVAPGKLTPLSLEHPEVSSGVLPLAILGTVGLHYSTGRQTVCH